MNWMKFSVSNKALIYSCVVAVLLVLISVSATRFGETLASSTAASPDEVFPANASTLGAVPDNDCGGPGRQVTFTVSGLTGAPSNIIVNFTSSPAHSWVGDIDAVLMGPGGSPSHVLFTFTGGEAAGGGFGDESNLAGPYNFSDAATMNWWAAAASTSATAPIPAGDYRTSNDTGANTLMNPVFAGVANPNGTWTLKFNDCASGDTGGISAASLTITTGGGGGTTQQHVVDYDGDGRTDASVVRSTGGGQATWYHDLSSNNTPAGVYQQQWGTTADIFVPEDYDGDDKTDIAVWRAGPPFGSFFYIFQSMTNTVRIDQFGQSGDDPTVTADYSGDGKADPAVYRDGATAADRSNWYYRASSGPLNGQIVGTQWGQGGDFPAPGNYNGDTFADFSIQRNNGFGQGVFLRRNGTGGGDPGGAANSVVVFGAPTDSIAPGDYDGDGSTDIATVRNSGGQFLWSIRLSSNSSVFTQFWGITGDQIAQGDYNGDGRTDLAVWRQNADPTQNFFFPFSIPGGKLAPIEWGQMNDYPVANFNVH